MKSIYGMEKGAALTNKMQNEDTNGCNKLK